MSNLVENPKDRFSHNEANIEMSVKDADRIAHSATPYQASPRETVWSRSVLFARHIFRKLELTKKTFVPMENLANLIDYYFYYLKIEMKTKMDKKWNNNINEKIISTQYSITADTVISVLSGNSKEDQQVAQRATIAHLRTSFFK